MSAARYAAYLVDVLETDFLAKIDMKLNNDYVVIHASKISDYINNYKKTAALWGGFHHVETPTLVNPPHKQTITQITAINNLEYPTHWHEHPIVYAIQQPFAFERFLKSYHLLELLFDWEVVNKIQTLGTDIYGAGKILASYGREEYPRLVDVIESSIKNETTLAAKLDLVIPYSTRAIDIFYKYGKESNPLKETDIHNPQKFNNIIAGGGFSNFNIVKTQVSGVNNAATFRAFLIKLSAYWLYRVRCCIAHHRLGEYLLTAADEEFIVKFAEPLLKEILLQCFTITE